MSSGPVQGVPFTFVFEAFQFPGGPAIDVTNLVVEIFDVTTQATVLGPTSVGIVHVTTGTYSLTWNVPANQAPDQYVIIWTATETTASQAFTVLGIGSGGIDNGPCQGWEQPIWTCALSPAAMAVTGQAVQAASDVLYALTGRHLGTCQLTIRPCRRSELGSFPFWSRWWDMTIWPRPVFFDGIWYNLTCGGCANDCSCAFLSQVELPSPVADVLQVKVDGVVLPSTAYRVDNYRLLVRTDGGQWPRCNNLALSDAASGTWSVTLTYGEQVSTLGQMALGELATEFAKLLACDSDCRIPRNVQQLVRQGVTQNFLDPNMVYADGRLGLYLCDLFIQTENPHRLVSASQVWDIDNPGYRIANT
jgi:hypothetical protein